MGASSLIVLMIAAIAFSGIAILISKLVVKATKNKQKGQPYECGVPTKGPSWIQFNVGYYLFALIFLIFDVELVFLYPWAVVVKKVGWLALAEIVIFFFILFIFLCYYLLFKLSINFLFSVHNISVPGVYFICLHYRLNYSAMLFHLFVVFIFYYLVYTIKYS